MKKMTLAIITAALALTVSSGSAADIADAAKAKANYEKHCAGCHGKTGKGDTKLGQKWECRDYTDPKVQEKLKDEEMFKAIKEGLKKGDRTLMKPYFPEKLNEQEIKDLVAYMRNFKK